jgi:P-type Cu+ transporter
MPTCDYCRGPITGVGHSGRPWPGCAAANYCCYGCLSLGEQRRQEAAVPSAGWKFDGMGMRLAISLIVVAQSMIFGLALNLHDDVPFQVRWLTQTLILGATLLVVALLGGPLARSAWQELRHGRLTIEALFLLTMTGAFVASIQAHLTSRGKIYFEVISILLVVYTLGKLMGARSRAAALASSRVCAGQLETCRRIDRHGRARSVPVTAVQPGDLIEVNPGETIAVDGVIRDGIGFVSEAPVTGEPFAVVRRPGDGVLAGAASHDTLFRIEATVKGTERQVDRLLAAVEESREQPISVQAQADRIGRWFLPLIVVAALGTLTYWTAAADWETGLFNAMSVLLVACPCVIGLAAPIIIWNTLGRLAERGLIVRSGHAIERLAEVNRVMLDKTGTLTDDQFVVLDITTAAAGNERAKLLGWLSLIQQHCPHPVARPFALLPRPDGESARILTLRSVPGHGVEAEIEAGDRRHSIQIGTPQWIAVVTGASTHRAISEQDTVSGHVIHVALDGELAAVAVLAERIRDSAPEALAAFRGMGLPVEVLTGDVVARARLLELPAPRGGLLPDDKRAAVMGGRVLFVGDGINDAAALASAHAGVALSSGTDLAQNAAVASLYHGDLRVLPWAVALSRAAMRSVRTSLYLALGYNLVGMTLAACGVLHPVAAALLMVASSLTLVFRATRVGVTPSHCLTEEAKTGSLPSARRKPERPEESALPPGRAACHGVAFGLQGIAFLLLLDSTRVLPVAAAVVCGFALLGGLLAYLWSRWSTIPHWLDMTFGMLTLGNLGMLLGWWADSGFAPLHDGSCRACVEAMRSGIMKPWMWFGMLVFANFAMLRLARRALPRGGNHVAAMFTGGNLGMVFGMLAGGLAAAQIEMTTVAGSATVAALGMTLGMIAGMLKGTWLLEKAMDLAANIRLIPRWLHAGRTTSSVG